jgi:plasmid stabilization system protein ParE
MFKTQILPAARNDIREAALWYDEQQKGLGKRFIQFIRSKVRRISSQPTLYALKYAAVHTAIVDVFPFMIHFVIDEQQKTIIVTAVLHTSQSPDIWKKREQ